MPETVGLLDLKIERLQGRLKVLSTQEAMSSAYPEHQMALHREYASVRGQLHQLIKLRHMLILGQANEIDY